MKSFEDINILIKVKLFCLKNLFLQEIKHLFEKKSFRKKILLKKNFKKAFFLEKKLLFEIKKVVLKFGEKLFFGK